MKAPSAELIELCGAVRDDIATAEQVVRLEALLAADPESRQFYRRFIQISAVLERYEQLPAAPAATESMPLPGRPRWRFGRASFWFALAAGFVVIASLFFNLHVPIERAELTCPFYYLGTPVRIIDLSL